MNSSNSSSASPLVRPFTACVIIDAEAFEMAQPEPLNATSLIVSPSICDKHLEHVAAERIISQRFFTRLFDLAKVSRILVVFEDGFLIKLV